MCWQVPFRRVHLQEANGHVDLYDTSGDQVTLDDTGQIPDIQPGCATQLIH